MKNTEDLILAGLLSSEEKVRVDFLSSLRVIAVNVEYGEISALNVNLGVLAKNFASISNKPSRQFFELFNVLIDLKAVRDNILGDVAANAAQIYDPEDLLSQIIDKIKQQQKMRQESSASADAGDDEVKAMEQAAEQERLIVGLVTLTGKIIAKADKSVSDRII